MNKAIAFGALAGVTALVLWLALRPADEVEVVEGSADGAIDPDGLDRSGPGDIDARPEPDAAEPDLSLAEAAAAIVVDAGRIDATVVTGIDAIAPTDMAVELDAAVIVAPDEGLDLGPDGGGPTISREAVRGAIDEAKPMVTDCYAQALRRTPDLAGRLVVKFTVVQEAGEGRIRDAEVVDEGLRRPFLEMCVLDALGKMVYPAPEGEGEVVVTYPFVLQPTAPE